jgi:hypothetical protein
MRCPVCKADNADGPACRRCKADLSLLFELERRRDWCLVEARRCLNAGNHAEACRLALCANGLRADAESQRLVAVTSLLCRQFAQALQSAHLTRSLCVR